MMQFVLHVQEQLGFCGNTKWDALSNFALDLICEDVTFMAENIEGMMKAADQIMDAYERRSKHLTFTITW